MQNKQFTAPLQVSQSAVNYKDIYELNAAAIASGVGNKYLKADIMGKVCDSYGEDYKKTLSYLLNELGSTKTTGAEWVGHHEETRAQRNFFILVAAAAGSAGVAKEWTIAPSAHSNGKTMPMVGDEMEIQGTGIFVQVIGKDTGGTNVKMGVNTSGVPITPGSLGGTNSANVLVVKPMIATQIVPAVSAVTPIIIHTTTVGVGSCPVDGYVRETDEYRYGFSQVRSTIAYDNNMVWKEVDCNYENLFKGKTFVSDTIAKNEMEHYRKVAHKIIFTPSATNTGLTTNGSERNNSNGIIPQITSNGGYTHPYSTFSINDFKTIVRYLTLNGGTTSYMIMGGFDIIASIQDVLRANSVPVNIQQIVVSGEKIGINLDFECITYNNIKFYFKVWDVFSSPNGAGVQYGNDAIAFPLDNVNALTLDRKSDSRKKLSVWFEKGAKGEDYTENNMWTSTQKDSTGCDVGAWHALTSLNVELTCANQFVYIKKN